MSLFWNDSEILLKSELAPFEFRSEWCLASRLEMKGIKNPCRSRVLDGGFIRKKRIQSNGDSGFSQVTQQIHPSSKLRRKTHEMVKWKELSLGWVFSERGQPNTADNEKKLRIKQGRNRKNGTLLFYRMGVATNACRPFLVWRNGRIAIVVMCPLR